MHSVFLRLALFLVGILVGAIAYGGENHDALPHWIGPPPLAHPESWTAQRSFTLPAGVQRAVLRFAADYCFARVLINDRPVLDVEPYCPMQDLDVTPAVRSGENRISIAVRPELGLLQGVALSLVFTTLSGTDEIAPLVSDGDWRFEGKFHSDSNIPADFDPDKMKNVVGRGQVRPELWGVGRRDASVSPLENYEQWRQATAADKRSTQKFYTPPGFEVSLLHTAGPDEGSWISFTFDAHGRALVSREDQGFLRLTLAEDRKTVTRVEPIASDLREIRGLLFDNGRFFADANNSKGIYSFRLKEDGGLVDQKLLSEFPGEVGHGRNDLAVGINRYAKSLFAIFGDSVARPENVPSADFRDLTSPLRTSRQRLAHGEKPLKEGYVVRRDLKSGRWQLYSCGLRNPYGIAAHPNGDLFTYDADNEFDMGTPWYRPTRILHLRGGADFGYTPAVDKRRPHFVDSPDNAQPVIDVGRGSPTAVMFGDALNFPPPYRDALFVLDWTYGRVLAVHLATRGAGYRAGLETFLQGRPLNVTDVAAGPDGAMYLITGGRKTQSSLYRVAFTGDPIAEPSASAHEANGAQTSQLGQKLRRVYEHFGDINPKTLHILSDLNSEDPTFRDTARTILEQIPPEKWLNDAAESDYLDAWMSVARSGDQSASAKLLDKVLSDQSNPTLKSLRGSFVLIYLLDRMQTVIPEAVAAQREQILNELIARWPDPARDGLVVSQYGNSTEFRRRLIYLLAKLEAPQAIDLAAKSLLASSVQEDKLAALSALSTMKAGWTPETRRLYFTALRDGRHFVGGQGMPGFLDQIRSDAVATLTEAEQKSLADLLAPPKDEDEPLPAPRAVVKQWTLDELAKLAAGDGAQGDATRGAEIFRAALCSRCHRAGANGPAVGPDLSFVAARFSRRDILHSVLAPAAAVAEQYRNSEIITADGRTLTGRVVAEGDYRSEKLLINVDPLRPSKVVEVDKKEIAEHRLLGTSPMPAGLLDGFTAAEVRDLLAFLEKPQTTARQ